MSPVQVFKALDCYAHQLCEHPGWPDSEAAAFCDQRRRAMIARLPGYERAEWEIDQRGDSVTIAPAIDTALF